MSDTVDLEPPGRRPTLARRLLVGFPLVLVAVLAALGVVLDRTVRADLLADLTSSLVVEARAVRAALPDDEGGRQDATRALGAELGLRITLVAVDGTVLADSERDPREMENHADRPEIRQAVSGRIGVDSRRSETVGAPFRYVALPPRAGTVVRVALPLEQVERRAGRVRATIAAGTVVAAAVGIVAAWLIARTMTRPLRRMTDAVSRLSAGGLEGRVPVEGTEELALLARTLNRMAGELTARIDESRRERETRDLILAAMEEGIVLVGPDDRAEYVNRAAARMLGGSPAGLRDLAPAALQRLIGRARRGEAMPHEEIETAAPARTIRASALPAHPPRRVLLVLRDVTEARRVEAMRRDFATNASHELKTPVAAIRAAAETVRRAIPEDPAAADAFAARLERDAIRLSRIVGDLLDLSRLESEQPRVGPVRLDRLVAGEIDAIRERAAASDLAMESALEPATVAGSRRDLTLLVANLLDNAVRYTPAGGRVEVRVTAHDGRSVLRIADTGVGIPSRDLPRIFERFYRVDRARSRDTGGTGLGLAIARHVTEQHGGTISVESELGRGTVFLVSLPLFRRGT